MFTKYSRKQCFHRNKVFIEFEGDWSILNHKFKISILMSIMSINMIFCYRLIRQPYKLHIRPIVCRLLCLFRWLLVNVVKINIKNRLMIIYSGITESLLELSFSECTGSCRCHAITTGSAETKSQRRVQGQSSLLPPPPPPPPHQVTANENAGVRPAHTIIVTVTLDLLPAHCKRHHLACTVSASS